MRQRILVPFTGGQLDPTVLNAAIRIARAEEGSSSRPISSSFRSSTPKTRRSQSRSSVAMPLLEAVEHAALREGIPVDARIEKGRSATHALRRLWEVENFDRIVAPAPTNGSGGLSLKDVTWILTHAPSETLVLKPSP